jgi:cell division transport system permease protein
MELVGATRNFIRRPFVIKSAWHGLISAMISIFLLLTLIYLTQKQVEEIIEFVDFDLLAILFIGVIITGILISTISSFFAVNKYLNYNIDDLYI